MFRISGMTFKYLLRLHITQMVCLGVSFLTSPKPGTEGFWIKWQLWAVGGVQWPPSLEYAEPGVLPSYDSLNWWQSTVYVHFNVLIRFKSLPENSFLTKLLSQSLSFYTAYFLLVNVTKLILTTTAVCCKTTDYWHQSKVTLMSAAAEKGLLGLIISFTELYLQVRMHPKYFRLGKCY